MAEPQETSKGSKESARFAEAVETTSRFGTVCLSYEQARRDSETAARKQLDEAYREYATKVSDCNREAQKRSEEIARNYWSSVESTESEQDESDRFVKADRTYQDAMREIADSVQKCMEAAERTYTTKANEAQVNGKKLLLEAYREYLRSVQQLWTRLDVDALADAYALTSV